MQRSLSIFAFLSIQAPHILASQNLSRKADGASIVGQEEDYRRFADKMAEYQFTWEPLKVTTEDGHILTTFHVTGNH